MQNMRHSFLGIVIICAVSIIFCLVSTFLLYETKKKYLGPEKDIERLFNATDAFHNALLEGLSYSPSHSKTEILSYIDANVEPAYIELEDSLKTVIAFSNGKMREFVGQSSFTVNMATAGSFFLILVVLTVAFFFYRLQKRPNRPSHTGKSCSISCAAV